jgi:DNA-binding CsgD family transcriptional regulator
MGISTNSARGHLRSILRKLSAADRADAVRRGQRPDEAS